MGYKEHHEIEKRIFLSHKKRAYTIEWCFIIVSNFCKTLDCPTHLRWQYSNTTGKNHNTCTHTPCCPWCARCSPPLFALNRDQPHFFSSTVINPTFSPLFATLHSPHSATRVLDRARQPPSSPPIVPRCEHRFLGPTTILSTRTPCCACFVRLHLVLSQPPLYQLQQPPLLELWEVGCGYKVLEATTGEIHDVGGPVFETIENVCGLWRWEVWWWRVW